MEELKTETKDALDKGKSLIKFDSFLNFIGENRLQVRDIIKLTDSEISLLKFLENSKMLTGPEVLALVEESKKINCSPLELFNEETLINSLSDLLGLAIATEAMLDTLDKKVIQLVPRNFAIANTCIPINQMKKTLYIALYNPFQSETVIELERLTGLSVKTFLACKKDILNAINKFYSESVETNKVIQAEGLESLVLEQEKDRELKFDNEPDNSEILNISYDDTPVVKMVNFVITQAIKESSSDVHIESGQNYMIVRNRVDGVLHEMIRLQKWIQNAFISRIKIIAKLDITEKRIPQDGKIKLNFEGKEIDIRVSTLPTNFGESVVLRILNTSAVSNMRVNNLGLSTIAFNILNTAIHEPQGIILVTGPTGSGKSTTLYSCLNEVNTPEKNIITVEDPVEYTIDGINQVFVNKKAGLTFAAALRAILRQDPNIIMIGEIRDYETAEIAFNASMTGHLVLSTLHTNDSVSSISRLLDIGIPRFMIVSSILVIVAQRLVRKICQNCSVEYTPDPELLEQYRLNKNTIFRKGNGCTECMMKGYKGRIGVYEVLNFDKDLKKMVKLDSTSEEQIISSLKEKNMKFLFDDALDKATSGLTTIEEISRVLGTVHLK